MAIGFSPNHTEDITLEQLSPEQFLVVSIETAKKLGWKLSITSEAGFIAFTKFSMTSWGEEITLKIVGDSGNIKSECTGNQIFDWGKNKENVNSFITTFHQLKNSFTPEELVQKYEELKPSFVAKEQDVLSLPPTTRREKISSFFSIFKPTDGYFITPIILNLNIAIFILMIASGVNVMLPDNESLLLWGANFKPLTLQGEAWRLITSCFLHIGIFHLLMNLYALFYIGLLLEPYLGKSRFATAYILSGITGSIASIFWNDLTISAGASGAIFGMYGVFVALLTSNIIEKSARQTLLTSIAIFVGYNIVVGLKPDSGIDNAAHIGGLIGGIIFGYAFLPSIKKSEDNKLKFGTIGLLSIVTLTSSFFIYKSMPNDLGTYDAKMNEFSINEARALDVYNLPPTTPNDEILRVLQDSGIYYWNQNIKLIDNFQELDLPLEIRTRNRLMREYCEIRIKSYELHIKAIVEDTYRYNTQIEEYNKQLEELINQIGGE
jgi:rhomboid protease GluP